jgi:lipopolysaccharide transport system permease protein
MILDKQNLLLVLQKSLSDLIAEARQGYIGILWWVIEPILYLSVFYFLFIVVFERGGKDAVAFLLVGLVIWKWFGSSVPKCAHSISANVGLIRQIYIPKILLPAMAIATTTMKFLIVFTLLIMFLVVMGYQVNSAWIALPILIFVQFIFTLAVGSTLSAILPFIPDLKIIIDNALLLLFFLSGVFFDFSSVSPGVRSILNLNPMMVLIDNYRAVLVAGELPDWMLIINILIASVILQMLGAYLLHRYDRVYPKIV